MKKLLLLLFFSAVCVGSYFGIIKFFGPRFPQRALFIGNSYTDEIRFYLDSSLDKYDHKSSVLEYITAGGADLKDHILNKKTIERIQTGNWDYVILQEQSQKPGLPDHHAKAFHGSVDFFTQLIRKSGAEPILYMTWGKREGDPGNKRFFPDYDSMQRKIANAYRVAASRNGVLLAPVGDVWAKVKEMDLELWRDLYERDGAHPSSKGSFLIHCVFLSMIFNIQINTIEKPAYISTDEWQVMKHALMQIQWDQS